MKELKDTPAYRYASAIMEGKKSFTIDGEKKNSLVGRYVRLAVERFFKDLEEHKYELDWKRGYKPILFTEKIQKHWEGESGKPFLLEPHQHFHWMNQFGWLTSEGNLRFNRSYKQIARKNGKTTECSLKGSYHVSQKIAGLECWVGATKEDQAILTVNEASKFLRENDFLRNRFNYVSKSQNVKRIVNKDNYNFIAALGRDSNTQDGLKPSYAIIDEYHEHKDTGTIDVLESGMVNRRDPVVDIITTAGFKKKYPCFSNTRKGVIDILEGKIENERMFGLIYEMDKDDDWENFDLWVKANPNLGVSCNIDQLKQLYTQAKMEGHTKIVNFKTKNLNQWVDAPTQWISSEIWNNNTHGIKEKDLHGMRAFGGLDLASGDDFNSFVILIPVNDKFAIKAMHWLPKNSLYDRKDGNDFRQWVAQGWIKVSGEDVIDFRTVAHDIMEECKKYNVKQIAYDPYKITHGTMHILEDNGIEGYSLYQGFKNFSTPTATYGELVLQGKFEHFNNPVLAWMMGNVVLKYDDHGNFIPSKGKSANKIDGVAATIDALAMYLLNPEEKKRKFVYI